MVITNFRHGQRFKDSRQNSRPPASLTVHVLEPRPKISPPISHYSYLSSGIAEHRTKCGRPEREPELKEHNFFFPWWRAERVCQRAKRHSSLLILLNPPNFLQINCSWPGAGKSAFRTEKWASLSELWRPQKGHLSWDDISIWTGMPARTGRINSWTLMKEFSTETWSQAHAICAAWLSFAGEMWAATQAVSERLFGLFGSS